MFIKLILSQIPFMFILYGILYIEPNILIKYTHCKIPFTTISLIIINILFEFLIYLYGRENIINKFSGIKMNELKYREYYKLITAHFCHKGGFVNHFLPNIIISSSIGTFIEIDIGNYVFLNMNLLLLLYWLYIYLFVKRNREGGGYSSLYYSYFSIYYSHLFLKNINNKISILLLTCPIVIYFLINYLADYNSIKNNKCSDEVHIISLAYGYEIVFLYHINDYI